MIDPGTTDIRASSPSLLQATSTRREQPIDSAVRTTMQALGGDYPPGTHQREAVTNLMSPPAAPDIEYCRARTPHSSASSHEISRAIRPTSYIADKASRTRQLIRSRLQAFAETGPNGLPARRSSACLK